MNSFYDIPNITLTDEYLTDPLLLALAWKRTHNYIRSHNWYADNFELDQSSLFLSKQCLKWSEDIERAGFFLSPLHLVPAPKTSKWVFEKSGLGLHCLKWQPEQEEKLTLRPLAHIGIREQTYFTHLMACLANIVETKQGDPATKFEKVHEVGVVSYGNRLYCTYDEDGTAEHNYGSTTIYSQYFMDYRKFLQRPYYFAQQQSTEKLPEHDVYIVELDLKRFYDKINRKKLINKIQELISEQKNSPTEPQVNNLLEGFLNWKWSEQANKEYAVCDGLINKEAPKGIPQGLVAGGFLSNIYLLNFDKKINKFLNSELKEQLKLNLQPDRFPESINNIQDMVLIDYCRYVDDIRLVITGPKLSKEFTLKQLTKDINHYVSLVLKLTKLDIRLNFSKTKVYPYRGKVVGLSTKLNDVQSKVSGPMGPEQVDDMINELENLLILSSNPAPDQSNDDCKINKLADIESNGFDIKEDTLKRFATNQLCRQLKEKRHFTAREADEYGNPIPGEWDYLQERVARRLIAVWSKDPSLVLLLKKGLELFPSPRLLEPILEQFDKITNLAFKADEDEGQVKQQQAIMRYCLAEIFRHSATVIHRKDSHAIPAHSNVSAFFEILQKKASQEIKNSTKHVEKIKDIDTWDFLSEQARFLLLVKLDTLLENDIGNEEQDVIFKLAKGFREINTELNPQRLAICILLAEQLLENNEPLVRATNEFFGSKGRDKENIIEIIKAISTQNPAFTEQLIIYGKQLKYSWVEYNAIENICRQLYFDVRPSIKSLDKITTEQGLIQLITRPDNPFANEIMAIKLMLGLIKKFDTQEFKQNQNKMIDLRSIKVKFDKGYSAIPKYEHFDADLQVEYLESQTSVTNNPEFLADDLVMLRDVLSEEQKSLRKIAFVIRAALASSKDITGFSNSLTPKVGYRGLKTSLTKRKIGLYTTPESLAGEVAQVTSWLTTLLTKLLRWPGIRVNEQGYKWPKSLDFKSISKLLKERLQLLKGSYCQLSNMPILPELLTPDWGDKKSLTVVMTQSKMPTPESLLKDLYLNDAQYRTRHRRHVAKVATLTLQYIQAQQIENTQQGDNKYQADLIVWPELAVHLEDLDVLIQLSQKTHAIIFAGLVFIDLSESGKPVNTAVWIVPRKHNGNQNEILRFQGKHHMMKGERELNIQPWRPYQLMLELRHPKYADKPGFMLTGAICLDATDIRLAADLTNQSNAFIISALNKDVNTFDSMIEALHYHMYQHVVLVNSGEYGGSYAIAPYKEHHDKRITNNTGKNQVAISSFEMNMFDFRRDGVGKSLKSEMKLKTPPAGVNIKSQPSN